jgi:chaperonin GroEL
LEEKHQMKGVHRERLARMTAKIAEIQIGGATDVERGEERDLIVDALNSAKSAMMHGVLPGGGVALYQASKLLEDGLPSLTDSESEKAAIKILAEALKQPIR